MNTLKFFAALFILLFSFANAHFEFEAPKPRGHDEDTISKPPCGGFDEINTSAVTDFPVTSKNS